jgi:methylglutaconyl-CoA hydratase
MAYENIEIDVSRGGVAVVLLNRPQKRNALNAQVIEELADAFEMLRRLYELPQLTITMVHGAAMAGACGLVAASDVAVAIKGAKFGFTEVKLGIIPATISPYVIGAIGQRWARALFTTAEIFDAEFAEKIGLVHYAVADETEMESRVEHLTQLAFQASPAAIADAKDLVADVTGEIIDASLSKKTAKRLAHRRATEQGKEGLAAFLEKRKPKWAE